MAEAVSVRDAILAQSFVRYIEIHDEIASTNDRAKELAAEPSIALPGLVLARRQTAGRGRGQNSWWSAEGALTFSLLLETDSLGVCTSNWPQLSLAIAVAICDALADEVQGGVTRLGIKWPNDVMLDGVKVCGILIESPGGLAPTKKRLVIGIGINVNNSWRQAPRDVGAKGIALCDVTAREHELGAVLTRTVVSLRERIAQVAVQAPQLIHDWQRLCWLTEQEVEVQNGSTWIEGTCLGIADDASLVVENEFGIHHVRSGSVRVL
jgi:BirA family biotin operon repressor/biotin-[acetyl-CoA-carboxylase] ligase